MPFALKLFLTVLILIGLGFVLVADDASSPVLLFTVPVVLLISIWVPWDRVGKGGSSRNL